MDGAAELARFFNFPLRAAPAITGTPHPLALRVRCSEEARMRQLKDLAGVGRAFLEDFEQLGVRSVADLARREPTELYERLCEVKGARVDICALDVFRAAVAQARNPDLPPEQRQWWYWSRKRKAAQE
jgi:hypothetical protein